MSQPVALVIYPLMLFAATLAAVRPTYGQGLRRDNGHAAINGRTIFAAWNFEAGRGIPNNFAAYPEVFPNLEGWDFRINLPHVRFQTLRTGHGSVPVLLGVVEGLPTDGTLETYGHINNSIWMFQVAEADRAIHFKELPSRRNRQTNTVQNVVSLASGWKPIAGPGFIRERVGAAVVGAGVGRATIYLAARAEDGNLHLNRLLVSGDADPAWPAWVPLGVPAGSAPALAPAFDSLLAMAWRIPSSQRIGVRLYSPLTDTWTATLETQTAAVGRPLLLWDGLSLSMFYVEKAGGLLKHSLILNNGAPTLGAPRTVLAFVSVKDDDFDVMRFNDRFHAVARHDAGPGNPTRLFYSTSTSVFGTLSTWAIPSEVGFTASAKPAIAYLNDNIFVIGIGTDGRTRYARKDPNSPGNDLTGAAFADTWLNPGQRIDATGSLRELDAISFNSDIYLAGLRVPSDDVQLPTTHLMNFGRAAMKRLITQTRRIRLLWGVPGGGNAVLPAPVFATFTPGPSRHPFLPRSGEAPNVGDFNGDGQDDLVRFAQRRVSGDGPAPVYVSLATDSTFTLPGRWHRFFALPREIPLVGDFNGDGKDDIVTFVQKRQHFADGTLLGHAPVWVALSDGTQFLRSRVWHRFFSLQDEIPMVGDFNGDGKDDIATFVQKPQNFADGTPLGDAPVWVALSDGTRFQTSRVWHTRFSLKGEVPMVGDFNGDGRADLASFVRKPQNADGLLLGNAPVWVALSDGDEFQAARVWHQDFAPGAQVPRVGDFDLDGRDDILSLVNGHAEDEDLATNIYVAFSNGLRFGRATTWHSDFARAHELPLVGFFSGASLATITGNPSHGNRPIPNIAAFGRDGDVHLATGLRNTPMPSGVPWEHYKWFNEKGLGTAMFPEWIWDGPGGCLGEDHRYALTGAAGSGGGTLTNLSVRLGGREGFVIQEVGHSIFRNCFRENKDPFGMWQAIFSTQELGGIPGINANAMTFCPSLDSFYDCRDPEHYFLGLLVAYRVSGEGFRNLIASSTGSIRAVLERQYNWLRSNWFQGTEFRTGPSLDANFAEVGLQLLQDP